MLCGHQLKVNWTGHIYSLHMLHLQFLNILQNGGVGWKFGMKLCPQWETEHFKLFLTWHARNSVLLLQEHKQTHACQSIFKAMYVKHFTLAWYAGTVNSLTTKMDLTFYYPAIYFDYKIWTSFVNCVASNIVMNICNHVNCKYNITMFSMV